MENREKASLKKVIGLPHATAMVVGTIIGASIFVQPSEIMGQVPSILGVFLVWIISGILTIFGALVCAELASIFTQSGGVYVYLKEAFSPAIGFLWGWAMFWVMHSGIIAVIAVVFSRYVAYFVPLDSSSIKAVAIIVIVALSFINYIGVKQGSMLQTLFTFGKLVAILAIIIFGFSLGSGLTTNYQSEGMLTLPVGFGDFALALVAGLFAFGGWHMVTYNAGETIQPRKTIPRALILGTAIVTFCYIALNAVYLYVLPLDIVASSTRVAADAADAVIGSGGGSVMSGLVIFSTFGALSGIILAGPRVYYAIARDGLVFKWLGEIHPKYRTPHRSILMQATWASILVATGTYHELFTRVIYTEWIFFGLMAIGLFVLRKRPDVKRDYSIWGYPVVPVIFILSAFAIVTNQIFSDLTECLFGLSLVLIGFPVYYFWAKNPMTKEKIHESN